MERMGQDMRLLFNTVSEEHRSLHKKRKRNGLPVASSLKQNRVCISPPRRKGRQCRGCGVGWAGWSSGEKGWAEV